MTVVHPIARAWISTGGTGARNYDEFADDAEITEIVAANPGSALAIEMPHRAPGNVGQNFSSALPDAVARLARQQADGSYVAADNVVVLYRIQPDRIQQDRIQQDQIQQDSGEAAYGIFAMVDTDQISTSVEEPGLVIRNEDVFIDKVRERVALAEATGHLLSPVLLLQTGQGPRFQEAIEAAIAAAGKPAVTDVDHVGRNHEIWTLAAGPAAELLALASGGDLVVADGNHRSLAAQTGGLGRFLAVITTPASVAIQPYHRLLTESPVPLAALLDRLRAGGAVVRELRGTPGIPDHQGTIHLYGREGAYQVDLPVRPGASDAMVDGMDHSLVERLVLGDGLGLEPGDKRIGYIGGEYPPEWLVGEVDAGRAELAILIAPVTVHQFVAVNVARQKMPRKSTWFTPKARGGLVLADLAAEG